MEGTEGMTYPLEGLSKYWKEYVPTEKQVDSLLGDEVIAEGKRTASHPRQTLYGEWGGW